MSALSSKGYNLYMAKTGEMEGMAGPVRRVNQVNKMDKKDMHLFTDVNNYFNILAYFIKCNQDVYCKLIVNNQFLG